MARKHHDLKSFPTKFQPVVDRTKLYEIRRNDRDFQTGDSFTLHEYHYDNGDKYTGRQISGIIGHIDDYSQYPGYVVFSLLSLGLVIIE